MFSATDFLPACMTEFMNFVTTTFPNFGSGRISRLSALWRRDICLFLRHGRLVPGHFAFFLALFQRLLRFAVPATQNDPLLGSFYLGRFAPYFDRRCLRFFTPCVSSTPRRM